MKWATIVLVTMSASIAGATYPNPDPRYRPHQHARTAPRQPLAVSPYEEPYQHHHLDLNPNWDARSQHRYDSGKKHKGQ
jgi:hypothetical protein